jgi:LytS/YehU family sensor histidine kinase
VKREILAVDQTGTDHQIEEEEIKTGKTKKSLDSTERK